MGVIVFCKTHLDRIINSVKIKVPGKSGKGDSFKQRSFKAIKYLNIYEILFCPKKNVLLNIMVMNTYIIVT